MIFDRRPIYLIGGGVALAIAAMLYFLVPKVTAEQRVQEQLAVVASEPWVRVQVENVQTIGSGDAQQTLVRGVRLDTSAAVVIDFAAGGPYTSPATLLRLSDPTLPGRVAEVKMLPRSMAREPYRSRYEPNASHVGVALFAGLPSDAASSSPENANPATVVPASAPATDG